MGSERKTNWLSSFEVYSASGKTANSIRPIVFPVCSRKESLRRTPVDLMQNRTLRPCHTPDVPHGFPPACRVDPERNPARSRQDHDRVFSRLGVDKNDTARELTVIRRQSSETRGVHRLTQSVDQAELHPAFQAIRQRKGHRHRSVELRPAPSGKPLLRLSPDPPSRPALARLSTQTGPPYE